MSKNLREGYLEHITKSFKGGGRMHQGYIILVRVAGDDTCEVGLAELRKLMGVSQLSPALVKQLMDCKPETVTFDGDYSESGYVNINTLQITAESAADWFGLLASKQP